MVRFKWFDCTLRLASSVPETRSCSTSTTSRMRRMWYYTSRK
jgi:hypothetical protein